MYEAFRTYFVLLTLAALIIIILLSFIASDTGKIVKAIRLIENDVYVTKNSLTDRGADNATTKEANSKETL